MQYNYNLVSADASSGSSGFIHVAQERDQISRTILGIPLAVDLKIAH